MKTKPYFKKITLAGIGLMGGSLGLAIKRAHLAGQVVGWARRPQTLRAAKANGCIDLGTLSAAAAADQAELVVFCAPVRATPAMLETLLPHLPPDCLLTDVGSTKAELLLAVARVLKKFKRNQRPQKNHVFIGSHPMAGSEKAGVASSRQDLYQGSLCLLVPPVQSPAPAQARLKAFWLAIGCRQVEVLSAQDHDRLTAKVSHLPHALAACLAGQVAEWTRMDSRTREVAGSGFLDTTRIAAGPAEMWADILLSNRQEVLKAMRVFQQKLSRWLLLLEHSDRPALLQALAQASQFRSGLEKGKHVCKKN